MCGRENGIWILNIIHVPRLMNHFVIDFVGFHFCPWAYAYLSHIIYFAGRGGVGD